MGKNHFCPANRARPRRARACSLVVSSRGAAASLVGGHATALAQAGWASSSARPFLQLLSSSGCR